MSKKTLKNNMKGNRTNPMNSQEIDSFEYRMHSYYEDLKRKKEASFDKDSQYR